MGFQIINQHFELGQKHIDNQSSFNIMGVTLLNHLMPVTYGQLDCSFSYQLRYCVISVDSASFLYICRHMILRRKRQTSFEICIIYNIYVIHQPSPTWCLHYELQFQLPESIVSALNSLALLFGNFDTCISTTHEEGTQCGET